MLIFQPEELTKSRSTLFHNLLLSSLVLYMSVCLVSALDLLGVYSMLQK